MLDQMIIFLLVSLGCSALWSLSEVMNPVRNFVAKIPLLNRMLLCAECASVWIGLAISFLFNPLLNSGFGLLSTPFVSNLALAACVYALSVILYRKEIFIYE